MRFFWSREKLTLVETVMEQRIIGKVFNFCFVLLGISSHKLLLAEALCPVWLSTCLSVTLVLILHRSSSNIKSELLGMMV